MEQTKFFFCRLGSKGAADKLAKRANAWLAKQGKIELTSRQTCTNGDFFCLSLFYKQKKLKK